MKEKIKDILECTGEFLKNIIVIIFIMFMLALCISLLIYPKYNKITDEHINCNHDWYVLEHCENIICSDTYTVFCKKCKLERTFEEATWNRILIDPEYQIPILYY